MDSLRCAACRRDPSSTSALLVCPGSRSLACSFPLLPLSKTWHPPDVLRASSEDFPAGSGSAPPRTAAGNGTVTGGSLQASKGCNNIVHRKEVARRKSIVSEGEGARPNCKRSSSCAVSTHPVSVTFHNGSTAAAATLSPSAHLPPRHTD